MNEIVADESKFVGPEIELRRGDVTAERSRPREVAIDRPRATIVADSEFHALLPTMRVVEGGEDDGGPELALVDQIVGYLIICISADRQPRHYDLADTDIEIVRALRLHRIVLGDLGRRGRAGKQRKRTRSDEFKGRRHEVASAAAMQGRCVGWFPHHIHAWAYL